MTAPTVEYDGARDRVVISGSLLRRGDGIVMMVSRDEAQALAEALTDAVDDTERVEQKAAGHDAG